jgi:hypothetical protein
MTTIPVKGFEGIYSVSDSGDVYSLSRKVVDKNGRVTQLQERKISPILKDGYLRVVLYKNGKSINRYLHVLVAEHFIPNPDNKPEVNHIDGNKLNCAKSNLEWNTRSENIRHMWKTGLRKRNKKTDT